MREIDKEFISVMEKYINKKIVGLSIELDEYLAITFDDNYFLVISDREQSCCERRWMTCDDDLGAFINHRFKGVELLGSSCKTNMKYDSKDEELFLRLLTDGGDFRVCMHNSHNGYYGGFDPSARGGLNEC